MQLVTVRFDRVFDVVPGARSRRRVTWFSFESAGQRHLAVSVPGDVAIREGATVTAALARAGDWHTLVGWVDHATGEMVIESKTQETLSVAFCCAMSAVGLFAYRYAPLPFGLALAGLAAWAAACVASLYRVNLARAALGQVQAALRAPPPG